MFEFLDGIELRTVHTVVLRKDDEIEPGKILGMKLDFNLGVVLGTMVGNSDIMHLCDG